MYEVKMSRNGVSTTIGRWRFRAVANVVAKNVRRFNPGATVAVNYIR